MPEHYVFDLYGTLVDIHTDETLPLLWEKLALYYSDHGASYTPRKLSESYHAYVREEKLSQQASPLFACGGHPEIKLEKVFAKLYQERGIQASSALIASSGMLFRTLSTEYIRLYDGAAELLSALHAAGKKTWLLSNAQRIFTEKELSLLGIADLFDGILLSSDEGYQKPDARFFRLLTERFGVDLSHAIMIGNDATADIAGACAVGMETLFIRSNISPAMTEEEFSRISATYKWDHMDLHAVRSLFGV